MDTVSDSKYLQGNKTLQGSDYQIQHQSAAVKMIHLYKYNQQHNYR